MYIAQYGVLMIVTSNRCLNSNPVAHVEHVIQRAVHDIEATHDQNISWPHELQAFGV